MLKLKNGLTFILLLTLSCAAKSSNEPAVLKPASLVANVSPATQTAVPAQQTSFDGTIRSVDFRNFVYHWYPKWGHRPGRKREFTLVNGTVDIDFSDSRTEPISFSLNNVDYGMVSSVGPEVAVLYLGMIVQGSALPGAILVYGIVNGKPKQLWAHETGDRADGGFRNSYFTADHRLVVEQFNPNKVMTADGEVDIGGACCSKTFTRKAYKWIDGHFKQDGPGATFPNPGGNANPVDPLVPSPS